MRLRLIILFMFLFQISFSQIRSEQDQNDIVNKKLMEAMSIPNPMVGEHLRNVFVKFQTSISTGFMQQGLSESVAMNSAIDSTFSVLERYNSFIGLYLKSKSADKDPISRSTDTRKEFVDSLCNLHKMERYCPTLDSILLINVRRIENLRKDLSKD